MYHVEDLLDEEMTFWEKVVSNCGTLITAAAATIILVMVAIVGMIL